MRALKLGTQYKAMAIKTVRPEEEVERFARWKSGALVGELRTRKTRPGQTGTFRSITVTLTSAPREAGDHYRFSFKGEVMTTVS